MAEKKVKCICSENCPHDNGPPYALYRKVDGRETFMGIASLDETMMNLRKLDDPNGELDGPGHIMEAEEFVTEGIHYDSASGAPSLKLKAELKQVTLMNFQDCPQDFSDKAEEKFDIKYPHGTSVPGNRWKVPQVRAYDTVKVMAFCMNGLLTERFWVTVSSVTVSGMVTGHCNNNLNTRPIKEGDLLAFPVTHVLGVIHGPYWKEEFKDGFDYCAGCFQEAKTDDLKSCSACHAVRYCSRSCQKKHWKKHKKTCTKK